MYFFSFVSLDFEVSKILFLVILVAVELLLSKVCAFSKSPKFFYKLSKSKSKLSFFYINELNPCINHFKYRTKNRSSSVHPFLIWLILKCNETNE